PPAPSETALLVHDLLVERGVRDRSTVSLVMPLPVPIPPSPEASQALLGAFADHDITFVPNQAVRSLDPARGVAVLADGTELPYDLFLGVPKHVAPPVVVDAGLCVDGWIPVDPSTLATSFPDVFAVGDVTSVGTPKAGVFAESQGKVVADAIVARHRGGDSEAFDGRGICYIEFGDHAVGQVVAVFVAGETPTGQFGAPSPEIAADKAAFGATRARRWFGQEWSNV
ncbi:MAG TPA: FAD-dependent oxidoreductase, partial [Acidimicrobiia bacterium]